MTTTPTPPNPRPHNYETHADHADAEGGQMCRMICDGGLAICKTCRGGESTLTTECPGVPMTGAQGDAVYAGKLDFLGGVWVEL